MSTNRKANASPTKAFFVRMLTRDISLDDCILDLVDNSIDGAWKVSGEKPHDLRSDSSLSKYEVSISISENGFTISDNCGGITLDDAANYAFTFGRREQQERGDFSVGVYGIGMKRAVFKLGNQIEIASTYREAHSLEAFKVPINVENWLLDDTGAWDFDIEENVPSASPGVSITVRELTPETSAKFSDPSYVRSLRRVLGRDYMVPLMRGLSIIVNGIRVSGWNLDLRENESFAPMRDDYKDGSVSVEILAGMAALPPDDREPDDEKPTRDVSGWYVMCNGRVVLAADTTTLTGWGAMLPRWHKQYSGFAGIVMFNSEDPSLLPMTTTKRNVDVSSAVYQRALVGMHKPTRAWIDYTNARKQNPEAVRQIEETVRKVDAFSVTKRQEIRLPKVEKPRSRERMANVNYSVPLVKLRALGDGFGDSAMTYREVGLKSFEYAYDDLAVETRNDLN